MFRARLNTAFGTIELEFENQQELEERLSQAREYAAWISSHGSDFVVVKERQGDPFSDLRAVLPSGKVQLLKLPGNKGDMVRLAAFLSSNPPTWPELVEISGVANPLAYVKKGELSKDAAGRYTLEAKSRHYVVNDLIPNLRR